MSFSLVKWPKVAISCRRALGRAVKILYTHVSLRKLPNQVLWVVLLLCTFHTFWLRIMIEQDSQSTADSDFSILLVPVSSPPSSFVLVFLLSLHLLFSFLYQRIFMDLSTRRVCNILSLDAAPRQDFAAEFAFMLSKYTHEFYYDTINWRVDYLMYWSSYRKVAETEQMTLNRLI